MNYVVVGICIVTVAVVAALLIYRKKKMRVPNQMEMLSIEAIPDESKLVEITDSSVYT